MDRSWEYTYSINHSQIHECGGIFLAVQLSDCSVSFAVESSPNGHAKKWHFLLVYCILQTVLDGDTPR